MSSFYQVELLGKVHDGYGYHKANMQVLLDLEKKVAVRYSALNIPPNNEVVNLLSDSQSGCLVNKYQGYLSAEREGNLVCNRQITTFGFGDWFTVTSISYQKLAENAVVQDNNLKRGIKLL